MTKIYYERGTGIRGEKIGYECRKLHPPALTKGSGKHRVQIGKMDKAKCVILQSLQSVSRKKLKLNKSD